VSVLEDNKSSELVGVGWQILPVKTPQCPGPPPIWSPLASDYRTVFCSGGFWVSDCLGTPSPSRKFCKNLKPDGAVLPSNLRHVKVLPQNYRIAMTEALTNAVVDYSTK